MSDERSFGGFNVRQTIEVDAYFPDVETKEQAESALFEVIIDAFQDTRVNLRERHCDFSAERVVRRYGRRM